MDVLVHTMFDIEAAFGPFALDAAEAGLDLGQFIGGKDALIGVGASPGYAACNVLLEERVGAACDDGVNTLFLRE